MWCLVRIRLIKHCSRELHYLYVNPLGIHAKVGRYANPLDLPGERECRGQLMMWKLWRCVLGIILASTCSSTVYYYYRWYVVCFCNYCIYMFYVLVCSVLCICVYCACCLGLGEYTSAHGWMVDSVSVLYMGLSVGMGFCGCLVLQGIAVYVLQIRQLMAVPCGGLIKVSPYFITVML